MKKYAIILFGTGEGMMNLPEEERNNHMKKWFDWHDELKKINAWVDGNPLNLQGSHVIMGKDKKVEERIFAEEHRDLAVGAYYTIKAESMEKAIEIGKGCPTFELDGNIEIREIMELPDDNR